MKPQRRGKSDNPKHRRGRKRPVDYGDLRLMVLDLVIHEARHGYEIIKKIEERFDGAYAPSPGSIYPTLAWLEDMGLVTVAKEEGGRKMAKATEAGRSFLEANRPNIDNIWKQKVQNYRKSAPQEIVRAMDSLKTAIRQTLATDGQATATDIASKITTLAKELAAGLPASTHAPVITRHKLEARRRSLVVTQNQRLTPNMIRIELEGDELADFTSPSADDHIKLFFPSGGEKPLMRDYTPRAYSNDARSLTLDFAVHDAGPATAWAIDAKPGDTLEIGGPRGSSVISSDFDWWLLIGDETALPSIGRRVEELGKDTKVATLVAVPDALDEQVFSTGADLQSAWVHRPVSQAAEPEHLLAALDKVEFPEGRGFVWIAAEATVVRALRDKVLERGHPRDCLKAAGYWVNGAAATSDKRL